MDIEEPLFQPFPSDIVFQNFEPFQPYEVPLQLRNNDKVGHRPKNFFDNTGLFPVLSLNDLCLYQISC